MKYLTYILRNARRNPVRSILTIASMGICLSLDDDPPVVLRDHATRPIQLDEDLQPHRLARTPMASPACCRSHASRRSPSSTAVIAVTPFQLDRRQIQG